MSHAAHIRLPTQRSHRRLVPRLAAAIGAVCLAATVGIVGTPSSAAAIVGGTYASAATYPFAAKVLAGDGICTGTVIAADTVLTAAHCVQHNGVTDQIGLVYLVDGFGRSIQHITVHPLWNGDWTNGHDLAVITLSPGATDNVPNVRAGAPWNPGFSAGGRPATLAGYGISRPDLVDAGQLRTVATVVRSDSDMDDIYNLWYWFDHWNETLMIGGGTTSQSICQGDSGGPLLVNADGSGQWVQIGVASFTATSCNQAAGYGELAGPLLAWLATQVPSITTGWGPCPTSTGAAGRTVVQYVPWALSYANGHDGQYDWQIRCDSLDPVPPPPPPKPPRCPGRPSLCQEP